MVQGRPGQAVCLLSLLAGSLYSFLCSFLEPVGLLEGSSRICCGLLIICDVLHATSLSTICPMLFPSRYAAEVLCRQSISHSAYCTEWQQHLIAEFQCGLGHQLCRLQARDVVYGALHELTRLESTTDVLL